VTPPERSTRDAKIAEIAREYGFCNAFGHPQKQAVLALSSAYDSRDSEVEKLKRQIQAAHNILRTDFGRNCSPTEDRCEICREVEQLMSTT
jgi:hypothetical protein